MAATDKSKTKSAEMLDELIAQAEKSREDIEITIVALKNLRDQLYRERPGRLMNNGSSVAGTGPPDA